MPVWDTVSYRVSINIDDPNLVDVCAWAARACVAAFELKSIPELRNPAAGLGVSGMYDRLVELTAHFEHDLRPSLIKLLDDESRASTHRDVLADISRARSREHESARTGLSTAHHLSMHELEWVVDALWHTFRYDQAAYPRTDEFAFQVSLFAAGVTGPRPGTPDGVQVARDRLTSSTIAAWFGQYSSSPSPRMVAFYDTLARLLAAEFRSFKAAVAGHHEDFGSITPLDPVAFSTNYDLEMERALQRRPEVDSFHVILPVYPFRAGRREPEKVRWLIGRSFKDEPVERPRWAWFPEDAARPRPSSIYGPILIKLHGSPLHTLPTPDDLAGPDEHPQYDRLEHAPIFSETEHLQHIVWEDPLPTFGETVLQQSERTLVFLGHSIKEWQTRLRMFTQIHRPKKAWIDRKDSRMLAINRTHDPFRSAALASIGVYRLVGDLDEFARLVNDVLE
jgi:hypothetical protein